MVPQHPRLIAQVTGQPVFFTERLAAWPYRWISFHCIPLAFEACRPRLVKGSLLFLHRSLLLLSGLLGSSSGLPAALTAPRNRPRRGPGLCVITHHLTYHSAFCSTANPGPGLGSRSGGRRFCRLLLGLRVSRIESGLLDRPRVTGGLVALLWKRFIESGYFRSLQADPAHQSLLIKEKRINIGLESSAGQGCGRTDVNHNDARPDSDFPAI